MSIKVKCTSNSQKSVVIEIGYNELSQDNWSDYMLEVKAIVETNSIKTHQFCGSTNWKPCQNVIWVIPFDTSNIPNLKNKLKGISDKFNQDPIAWIEGTTQFI